VKNNNIIFINILVSIHLHLPAHNILARTVKKTLFLLIVSFRCCRSLIVFEAVLTGRCLAQGVYIIILFAVRASNVAELIMRVL
jgi:hypothetical protein